MDNDHIFVKVEDYNSIKNTLSLIQKKLENAKKLVEEISKLKKEEENQLDKWGSSLNDIEEKMRIVNTNLYDVYN